MLRRKVFELGLNKIKPSYIQRNLCLSTLTQKYRHFQRIRLASVLQQKLDSVGKMNIPKLGIHSSSSQLGFEVQPAGFLLVDEELQIVLHGLKSKQIITIHAVLTDDKKVYESCATFKADLDGVINLARDPSKSGTYTGVSSMGLFWSMIPAPGQQKGIRLMKKNMDTPFKTILYAYNGKHSLEDLHNIEQTPLQVSEIERWYKGENVITEMVRDGNVRGKLFLPGGSGPFPGIIDLFGTVGGLTEHRAALFASRGFATLALPYFAYEDLPKSLGELSLDYFLEAIDWLLGHKRVHSQSVGVIGTSKGGDLALLMGAYSTKVSAVVNVNGCTFNASIPLMYSGGDIPEVEMQMFRMKEKDGVYSTYDVFDYSEQDLTPGLSTNWRKILTPITKESYHYGGNFFYEKYSNCQLHLDKLTTVDDACVMKTAFEYDEKDLIPVWRYNPKVLHILSEDDYCSPKECIRLMKRCYPADKTDNCTILAYDKAGHLVEPPYSALCRMSYHKSFDMYFMWGGYPEEHAKAQEHAWKSILSFFRQNIPKTPKDSIKSNL